MNKIAKLNDKARANFACLVLLTPGVQGLPDHANARVLDAVRKYTAFDPPGALDGNDPYGEHDFGAVQIDGETYFWKFDYYADKSLTYGAKNPAEPSTVRVLTIMHASEY